jgi:hypothetical protein
MANLCGRAERDVAIGVQQFPADVDVITGSGVGGIESPYRDQIALPKCHVATRHVFCAIVG